MVGRTTWLDKLVSPELKLLGRSFSAFHIFGIIGFCVAIFFVMIQASRQGLSLLVMLAVILVPVLTTPVIAMAIKIINGDEQLVHYRYVILIEVATIALLWVASKPILPFLDLSVLGIGIFMVFGRVGCFMVGCCYGRPHRWGVCYRQEHADVGLVPCYVGVRLFPIQLADSLWTLLSIGVGMLHFLSEKLPCSFLTSYVVSYGCGRFFLEFWRGDSERPYFGGYSEAQWTSILLIGFIVWAERSGILPLQTWHGVALAGLVVTVIGVALKRRFQSATQTQLFYPVHIKEVAEALDLATKNATELAACPQWSIKSRNAEREDVCITSTSLGVQLSASKIKSMSGESYHYALSHRDGGMTARTAMRLAQLIVRLRRAPSSSEIQPGGSGVFHLFIHSQS